MIFVSLLQMETQIHILSHSTSHILTHTRIFYFVNDSKILIKLVLILILIIKYSLFLIIFSPQFYLRINLNNVIYKNIKRKENNLQKLHLAETLSRDYNGYSFKQVNVYTVIHNLGP